MYVLDMFATANGEVGISGSRRTNPVYYMAKTYNRFDRGRPETKPVNSVLL
jgi:hypothetical protein